MVTLWVLITLIILQYKKLSVISYGELILSCLNCLCCCADVRAFMFQTYCTSYYGSPLWSLNSNIVNSSYVTCRSCIRKVLGIPRRTHCRLLNNLNGGLGIEFELMSRYMSFLNSISMSNNACTHLCYLLCKSSQSHVAINRRILLCKLNTDVEKSV